MVIEMCEWQNKVRMQVQVPPSVSHTRKWRTDYKKIDACIAPLVRALNSHDSITTIESCCGHEDYPGYIALSDGRVLVIAPSKEVARPMEMAGEGVMEFGYQESSWADDEDTHSKTDSELQ